MGRRRQAEKITLTVKGEPSAATLPVEIALCLPCMSEIREAEWRFRSGGGRETGMVSNVRGG